MGWWRLLLLQDAGGSIASCASRKQDGMTETSGKEQILFPTFSLWKYVAVTLSQRWSFYWTLKVCQLGKDPAQLH